MGSVRNRSLFSPGVVGALAFTAFTIALGTPLHAADDKRQEKQERTLVAGTVVDVGGKQSVGARVWLIDGGKGLTLAEAACDASGRFELSPQKSSSYLAMVCFLRAESTDGKAMSLAPIGTVKDGQFVFPESQFELKLSPIIRPKIAIQNAGGKPVKDCPVILQAGFFKLLLRQTTGPDGIATFKIPTAATVSQLYAWKDRVGFAFRSYTPDPRGNAANSEAPPDFDPERTTLRLSGFRSVKIRLVDGDNQPLEGHTIYPWLINSPERVSAINLSLMQHDFTSTTDEDGVAQFDWIPDWQTRMMTFWNSGQPGWTHRRVTVDPNAVPAGGGIHATLKIEKLIPFSGRVMDQQGNPVPDATVTLAGEHGERHSSTPRTDAQGRYEIKVPPRMNFLITAKQMSGDRTVAIADTMVGLVIDKPVQAPDLVLRKPTIVSGVLRSSDGDPVPGERIISYHYGMTYSELPAQLQQQLSRPRGQMQPIAFNDATTDEQGRFEFALGNGSYDFRPPNQKSAKKLDITDGEPQSIELTYEKEEAPQNTFEGQIVLPDGTPVEGIVVEAVTENYRHGWKTTTDKNGEFSVQEYGGRKSIRAVTKDQTHGAIVSVAENESSQTVTLQPTCGARLTLLDKQGDPVAFRMIKLSETVYRSPRGSFRTRSFGTAKTDGEGVVEFTRLIPNVTYRCYFADHERLGRRQILARFEVQPGDVYEATANVTVDRPEP
ncbi:carboxypeptidase regulatory-like domain-containing protein [Roseiconus nitratireducens]|nr:carboxypeptidase regulatory-like domain-containing protein [Roseiconus nitratireducens]